MPLDGGSAELFAVAAEGYDRMIGRYLETLGPAFAGATEIRRGDRVLDVGCGPGGLTGVLLDRVGVEGGVAAIDPSVTFVAACRAQHPGADVREGTAEHLPWPDSAFDASLACLVVGFMNDPYAGIAEMYRTVRPGGRVAACFWALDEMPLLDTYWEAVDTALGIDDSEDERFGRRRGEIAGLLIEVGLVDVVERRLTATVRYADLDDWWSSFTGGAGPAGAHLQTLAPDLQARLRRACERQLMHPHGPFSMTATAWCAVGTVPA